MDDEQESKRQNFLSIGVALGVALGAGVGVALGNIALGIGIGVALGAALGSILRARRSEGSQSPPETSGHDDA